MRTLLLLLLLLAVRVAPALAQDTRDVSVELDTFVNDDTPYLYVAGAVDEHGVGGVSILFIGAGGIIVDQVSYPLAAGDLVVNAATTSATLRITPSTRLLWTATRAHSTVLDLT
jgi:hypothetical protein